MEEFHSFITRFPECELDMRRRSKLDPDFRSICTDYEEAAKALRYWTSVAEAEKRRMAQSAAEQRAHEYERFLRELEAEIFAHLRCAS